MATKLKNGKRVTKWIAVICLIVPAVILVSLYPRITDAMKDVEREYAKEYSIGYTFINQAVKASYYLYGQSMEESSGQMINYDVLRQFNWIEEFNQLYKEVTYQYEYFDGDVVRKGGMNASDYGEVYGVLTLNFDSKGLPVKLELSGEIESVVEVEEISDIVYFTSEEYRQCVLTYNEQMGTQIDEEEMQPKNFKITFLVYEDSAYFNFHGGMYAYVSPQQLLYEVGYFWILLAAVLLVAILAIFMPAAALPIEGAIFSGGSSGVIALGMTELLVSIGQIESLTELMFLGEQISEKTQYMILLGASAVGWFLCFTFEYLAISSLRNFVSAPMEYLKERCYTIKIWRKIWKRIRSGYHYFMDVQIEKKVHRYLVAGTCVNFIIVSLLCVLHYLGNIGAVVYSLVFYVVMRKYLEKIVRQYNGVLKTTEKMAEGDMKISLEEDLGVFKPLGEALENVHQGLAKAISEEAKSQSMKTELITNVSHDLKTPLTAIITYIDLLKKEDISEEEKKSYLATLEQKSQRLKVLIEDLFEVSKAHSGNVVMNYMDVDVVSLMKQVRFEMADMIEQSDLVFRWNLPEEKIILSLDGQRTYRVFENLLGNALKYSLSGSRVYVDVVQNDQQVDVIFRNTSAQELNFEAQQLTERFVRGDVSRNSEGNGLGLAIAKSFVELQKGKISIDVDGDLFKVTVSWKK